MARITDINRAAECVVCVCVAVVLSVAVGLVW